MKSVLVTSGRTGIHRHATRVLLLPVALLFTGMSAFAQFPDWQNVLEQNVSRVHVLRNGTVLARRGTEVLRSFDGGSTWEAGGTIAGGPVSGSAVFCESPDGTIYAGLHFGGRGLFRSSDSGASWNVLTAIGTTTQVVDVACSSDQTLYAGTEPGGLQRSTDGGETWQTLGSTTLPFAVWSVLPLEEGRLLAGTQGEGVFLSLDNGLTWNRSLQNGVVVDLIRGDAGTLFAGLDSDGLARSNDAGETWEQVDVHFPGVPESLSSTVQGITHDPASGRLYAWNSRGLVTSGDDGTTWQPVSLPDQENLFISSVSVDPDGSTLFIATSSGLFRAQGFSSVEGVPRSPSDLDISHRGQSNESGVRIERLRSVLSPQA